MADQGTRPVRFLRRAGLPGCTEAGLLRCERLPRGWSAAARDPAPSPLRPLRRRFYVLPKECQSFGGLPISCEKL